MFVAETQTEVHATHPNLDILIIYIEIHVENKHSVLSNKMKQCNVIFIYLKLNHLKMEQTQIMDWSRNSIGKEKLKDSMPWKFKIRLLE